MKDIAESTEKQYVSLLNNIEITKLKITKFDSVIKKINKITTNESTQKTYLSALLWYIRSNELDIETEPYNEEILRLANILNERRALNKNSSKEAERFIKWNEFLDLKDEILDELSFIQFKNPSLYKFYLLLSIYTDFPPRRLQDYSEMIYVDKKPKVLSNDVNYIIIPQNFKDEGYNAFFIFNKYKTAKSHKTQEFIISTTLKNTIANYIIFNDIQLNDSLLNTSSNALCHFISKYLHIYTGKKATLNTIRHSYATFIENKENNEKLSVKERKDVADKMGHGLLENMLYSKHK